MPQYEYNIHTLDNGLRIIHLPSDSEVVYCGYAINAGSRNEEPDEEGLAHFCEHMTFKGSQRFSSLQIINRLERVGGDLNAFTTKEDTFYYAAVLRQHFLRAVDLLTDIVFHSRYPQGEIDKEVEVVCDEIESYRDSPAELIYDDFENEMFRGCSLGHNILGESDKVRTFTTEDCQNFTQKHYRTDNAVFYVLGNINFSRLVAWFEKTGITTACKDISVKNVACSLSCNSDLLGGKEKTDNKNTHQSHVMMGVRIADEMERWRIPLYLANNILGGPAMNSRLNLSLRERRGLVYTVESVMTSYTDALLWTTYFGCDNSDMRRCKRLVCNELLRLCKQELSATVIERAKRQIKGQLALASENKENYAIDMAKQYLHKGTLKNMHRLCNGIDSVTPNDIHALACRYLNPDSLFTLTYQ